MTPTELVTTVMREVNDLPPWAITYRERPEDLLEIRASELEAILRDALQPTTGGKTNLINALRAYMEPAGDTAEELRAQARLALAEAETDGPACGWFNGLWCERPR